MSVNERTRTHFFHTTSTIDTINWGNWFTLEQLFERILGLNCIQFLKLLRKHSFTPYIKPHTFRKVATYIFPVQVVNKIGRNMEKKRKTHKKLTHWIIQHISGNHYSYRLMVFPILIIISLFVDFWRWKHFINRNKNRCERCSRNPFCFMDLKECVWRLCFCSQ